jgi:TonB family protein
MLSAVCAGERGVLQNLIKKKENFMKMMKLLISIAIIWGLISCVTVPELYLSGDPVEVDVGQLEQYWIQENESFRFNISPSRVPEKGTEGFVKIRFLIDSNGNIFNPKIIESVPEGAFDYSAAKALRKHKYIKAESNANATPVFVTTEIKFST